MMGQTGNEVSLSFGDVAKLHRSAGTWTSWLLQFLYSLANSAFIQFFDVAGESARYRFCEVATINKAEAKKPLNSDSESEPEEAMGHPPNWLGGPADSACSWARK